MTNTDILSMLKSNLEIMNTIRDDYLSQLIEVSKKEIDREGITITPTEIEVTTTITDDEGNETTETTTELSYEVEDANLIVMYAAWLYRNRAQDSSGYTTNLSATGMPRMLRYALNNRLFSQKMGAST